MVNETLFFQFKTPRVEGVRYSPEKELPRLETEDGSTPMSELIHTVSFYRKTRTATNRDSVSAPSSKENAIEALEQHKMLDYKKVCTITLTANKQAA